ncbi:PTS sugar transporter subunit IIB [Thermoanaerobacter pentosaceus]|uniref:PTS system cellobiose-specific IIB component n=1 Tax=Thermoanaerobacter pentosaceus TaxID=694059 RepID=A0ABT9M0V9_9THEO|nr:PTS sugar transporter subunit IIB [Thermoanaerobacter pentosaceus]MDP9749754.1 PTS system cellobiose-specific IIB component [Thermoanaerobacter pentosaceus]
MIRVLLVCGSGASSGFMAANIRKAAEKRGIEVSVEARSDSEIDDYIDSIDCLMIGPHLKYIEAELREKAKPFNVRVAVMDPKYYATLDGEKALEHIMRLINEKK